MRIRLQIRRLSPLAAMMAVFVTLTACASSYATRGGEAEQIIQRQSAAHVDAWLHGDAERVSALYDADGAILFPDAPDVRGRSNVRDMLLNLFGSTRVESLEVSRELIEVFGNVAYEWGTYREVSRPQGKASVQEDGRYVMRWKRQVNGEWLISRFTGNSLRRSPT